MGAFIGLFIMLVLTVLLFVWGVSPVIVDQADDSRTVDPVPTKDDDEETE